MQIQSLNRVVHADSMYESLQITGAFAADELSDLAQILFHSARFLHICAEEEEKMMIFCHGPVMNLFLNS